MIFGGFRPERGWAPNGTIRGFSRRATAQAPTVGFSGSEQVGWAGRAVESAAFFPLLSGRAGGRGGVHCMGVWIHIQDLFEHRPPRAGFGGLTPRPRVWRPPVSVMTPPVMKGRKRRVVALRTVPRMARCASNGAIRLANHAAGGRVLVAKLERSLANRHVGKRGLYPLFEGPRCFRWVNKPSRF